MAPLRSLGNIRSTFDDFYARTGKDAVSPEPRPNSFSVSGGNATSTGGGYKYFYFTSPGNLAVQKVSGDGELEMSFMLIGAGGGGQSTGGGGGGAGAFVQKIDYPITSVPSSSVNWAVAIGGASSPYESPGDGGNSTFTIPTSPKTFTAAGGGSGRQNNGNPGGSGGGGGRNPSSGSTGGSSSVPQTIDGSGNTPDTGCLLYTSPSPRDGLLSRMPSSA